MLGARSQRRGGSGPLSGVHEASALACVLAGRGQRLAVPAVPAIKVPSQKRDGAIAFGLSVGLGNTSDSTLGALAVMLDAASAAAAIGVADETLGLAGCVPGETAAAAAGSASASTMAEAVELSSAADLHGAAAGAPGASRDALGAAKGALSTVGGALGAASSVLGAAGAELGAATSTVADRAGFDEHGLGTREARRSFHASISASKRCASALAASAKAFALRFARARLLRPGSARRRDSRWRCSRSHAAFLRARLRRREARRSPGAQRGDVG